MSRLRDLVHTSNIIALPACFTILSMRDFIYDTLRHVTFHHQFIQR